MVGPVENGDCRSVALVVPRTAYSHSASVIRRYRLPVFFASQLMNCWVSFHDTLMIGRLPRPQLLSLGLCVQPASATHASHCAKVTSYLPTAKGCAKVTLRCGPSSRLRPRSPGCDPMRNSPAG